MVSALVGLVGDVVAGGERRRRVVVRGSPVAMSPEQQLEAHRLRLERLAVLMEDWAAWDRGYHEPLGFRASAAGLATGSEEGAARRSSVDAHEEAGDRLRDRRCTLIAACVEHDLSPIQRAAVLRRYGLAAVFRFPRLNYAVVLDEAHGVLLTALPRRGVDIR